MLPMGTNCIKLLELMSINLTMATTWQSDIRYHSESQSRSHIHSCQTCFFFFFGFRFWEWEELNSEELLGAWWCHVYPIWLGLSMLIMFYADPCRTCSHVGTWLRCFKACFHFGCHRGWLTNGYRALAGIGFLLASVKDWSSDRSGLRSAPTMIYYKYWSFSST